jgi:riboflavin biosynthesis pyrimidine reductase
VIAPTIKSGSSATRHPSLDLRWLLKKLGAENVTSLLVEGGGEVNASFLLGGLAQRVAFFYAPKFWAAAMPIRAWRARARRICATPFPCAKSGGTGSATICC